MGTSIMLGINTIKEKRQGERDGIQHAKLSNITAYEVPTLSGLNDGINQTFRVGYFEKMYPELKEIAWEKRRGFIDQLHKIYLDGGGKLVCDDNSGENKMANMGKWSHKYYEGYCFISSKYLEKRFGPGKFNEYIEIFECLEVIPVYKIGDSTKAYRLTEKWVKAFEAYYTALRNGEILPNTLVDKRGDKILRKPKNNNAIQSKDKFGNDAKTKAFVPYTIQVNAESIAKTLFYFLEVAERIRVGDLELELDYRKGRFNHLIYDLTDLYHLSRLKEATIGTIPQRFREDGSGRLYGVGFNLQSTLRELKWIAFSEMDLVEYDISNCHFTILYQLAYKHGYNCEGVKYYLTNKKAVRERIAIDIYGEEIEEEEITLFEAIDLVKDFLIAAVNGGQTKGFRPKGILDKEKESKNIERLSFGGKFDGNQKAIMMSHHETVRFIVDDLQDAVKHILKKHKGFVNVMRKRLRKDGDGRRTDGQISSHLVRGEEVRMLNMILELHPGKIILPMHDGFVCTPDINPQELSEEIFAGTGFWVDFEMDEDYRKIDFETAKQKILERVFPFGKPADLILGKGKKKVGFVL